MAIDNHSRRPLFLICAASAVRPLAARDVVSVELAPREDKQVRALILLKIN